MSHLVPPFVKYAPAAVLTAEREVIEESLEPLLLPMPLLLERSDREPFRYCLNTSTLRGHKLPLDELIDIAASAGYEAIEPWIDEIDAYHAAGGDLRDLHTRIRDMGLTIESAIGFFEWMVDDDAQRAKGLEEARRSMGMLARIGGKRIAAPAWGAHQIGTPKVDLMAAAERYQALLAIGDSIGVVPQVEVWGFSQNLNRLGEAVLIAIESGHPDACVLADVYHLYKGGSPISGLRMLSADTLRVFHVNDYPNIAPDAIQDSDRVYPGDGIAPLVPIFRDLSDIGFHGFLSLELFNTAYYADDPLLVARTGLEKLRSVVQQSL